MSARFTTEQALRLPRPMRRHRLGMYALALSQLAPMAAIALLGASADAWLLVVLLGLLGLWLAGSATLLYAARTRLRRRVERHGYAVCTRCMYPLHEAEGSCPECGEPYRIEHVRRVWKAYAGPWRAEPPPEWPR